MKIHKLAAIDIGSNGIRLLISNVYNEMKRAPVFKKSALVRVPIRLGADTFTEGTISEVNRKRIKKAMQAFTLLMEVHGVEKYRACATSAMREAKNGKEVAACLKKETGVNIEIIDGKTEAAFIAATDLYEVIDNQYNYLYTDVGGGSTEFTIFSNGKPVKSKSFKVGTVRALEEHTEVKTLFKDAKEWIKKHTKDFDNIIMIGSGGNINKVFKMSQTKLGKPLSYDYLKKQFKALKNMTYEQRMLDLGLNPDRADVIIPALEIYIYSMKWVKANKIIVPKIGVADGIIKLLYQEKINGNK